MKFIKNNTFTNEIDDDKQFFFNLNYNDDNEIEIGTGSTLSHLNLSMTSKNLMKLIQMRGVFHIDGTYKITSHGYPLVVHGITDLAGVFHPIAFMISSHETEADFYNFYRGLTELAESLGLSFNPEFFIQDAQRACYNAIKKLFPRVIILMCYYHVAANLRKHRHLLIKVDRYDELKYDIDIVQQSLSREEYEERRETFYTKWVEEYLEQAMFDYIHQQWFTGVFTKWQVYRNFPGYANTNSNLESFNSTYKRDFNNRLKMSIVKAAKCVFKCILFYSLENGKNNMWSDKPAFDRSVKEAALLIDAKSFKATNSINKISYIGKATRQTITINDTRCYKSCSCTCFSFNKWAICSHVVAYSYAYKHSWYGNEYRQPVNFVRLEKRGAPKRLKNTGRFSLAELALKK